MMRIDVHAHFTERSYYEDLATLPGVTVERHATGMSYLLRNGSKWLPFRDFMFDPDAQLRDMDRKGIDLRILSLSTPSVYLFETGRREEVCRRSNDLIVEQVRKAPVRFRAVATLPLPDVDAALEELERVRRAEEIVGVAMGSNLDGVPLSDPRLENLWSRLDELRLPVIEHPMIPLFADAMNEFTLPFRVGFMLDTSLALCRMIYAGVFERYPNFPFVVAHTGASFLDLMERLDNGFRLYEECRQHITRLPSEYAKSLYYDSCCFFTPLLSMAREIVGADRILFGTDYPFIDMDASHVQQLGAPAAEENLLLGGNAARLFGLKW